MLRIRLSSCELQPVLSLGGSPRMLRGISMISQEPRAAGLTLSQALLGNLFSSVADRSKSREHLQTVHHSVRGKASSVVVSRPLTPQPCRSHSRSSVGGSPCRLSVDAAVARYISTVVLAPGAWYCERLLMERKAASCTAEQLAFCVIQSLDACWPVDEQSCFC